MSLLQKALAMMFIFWATISSIIILARGGSWFEEGRSGFQLIWKHSPPFWRKFTLWFGSLWMILLIVSFIVR